LSQNLGKGLPLHRSSLQFRGLKSQQGCWLWTVDWGGSSRGRL